MKYGSRKPISECIVPTGCNSPRSCADAGECGSAKVRAFLGAPPPRVPLDKEASFVRSVLEMAVAMSELFNAADELLNAPDPLPDAELCARLREMLKTSPVPTLATVMADRLMKLSAGTGR